jgi:hypothetical protein
MKKMKCLLLVLLVTFAVACGQKAQTFDKVATFNAGFRFSPTGTIYTSMPVSTTADWNTLLNKPTVFPTTWALVAGKPLTFNPDLSVTNPLYKPIGWKPDYNTDILNVPEEVELSVAILQIPVLFEILTQTQINALALTRGKVVINSTDNVMQWCDGTKWNVFLTNQ